MRSKARWAGVAALGLLLATVWLTAWTPRVIAQDAPPDLNPILDRIGQLRLSGEYGRALKELQLIEEQLDSSTFQGNHLDYLKAVLLFQDNQHQAACSLFLSKAGSFPLRENLLLHLIDCSEGSSLETRRPLFEEFLKYPGPPRRTQTLFDFARLLEESGNLAAARERYDQIWKARGSLWREAAFRHAMLHVQGGDRKSAIQDLENLIQRHETGAIAHQAVLELARLQPLDALTEAGLRKRARIYLNQRDTGPARKYLQELLERYPGSASKDQYLNLIGRSYVLDEDFRTAIESYQTAYRVSPSEEWGVRSKYQAANTALLLNNYGLAKEIYEYVIKAHPENSYSVDARYNLADTLRWMGNLKAAEGTAREALNVVKSVDKRRFSYFLARLYFEQKRYSESLAQLAGLERYSDRQLPPGVTTQEILYWKGLDLEQLDRPAEAAAAFTRAARSSSNYFAQLAGTRLEPGDAAAISPDEEWFSRLLRPRELGVPGPPAVPASDRRSRVAELLFLRLYDEAATEIRSAGSALFQGRRADYLFNRAYFSALGGLAEDSLAAADLLERTAFSRSSWEVYPRVIQTLLFPRHYSALVRSAANEYKVEADFILAVIKQESRFEEDAFSPATARGLMQFMQPTAQTLSREAGFDLQEADQLYQPELSIRLGGLYLRKLLDEFDGSMEIALAAYNGGAANAARWNNKLTWRRPDLFVANIGFRETKLYVLTVMGNYFRYKRLYAAQAGWDSGNSWLSSQ